MELIFDDPDNPVTREQIEAFIAHVNNQPEFSIDYSGAEKLYQSTFNELQLKKHDTLRLLTLQSQCSSALHFLEIILIDYQPKLNELEINNISKLIGKLISLLKDIRKRIDLYKYKEQQGFVNNVKSDEVQSLVIVISMQLNTIADSLKKDFPAPDFDQFNLIYSCVSDKLSKADFISNMTYIVFEKGFNNTLKITSNKGTFLSNEIHEISNAIDATLSGIKENARVNKDLSCLILIGKEKKDVLKSYFNRYLLEGDYEVFVSVFFCYDLMQYLNFLKSDRVTQMLKEPSPGLDQVKGIYTQFTSSCLSIIFNGLKNLNHVKEPDRNNFIAVFQENMLPEGWSKITWYGSKPKHYSLFSLLTGQHEPSLRNKYFNHESKIPFDSHDKPRTNHHEISNIINKVKNK